MRSSVFGISAMALLALGVGDAGAAPRVITSILPVHSLVAGVMGNVATPELLLQGANSEHTASFSPQQISDLGNADLVFMIGAGLELKLDEISGSDAVNGKSFIELATAANVKTFSIREGGGWEAHDHKSHAQEEAETGHDHGVATFDPHVWLDPENAKAMTLAIAAALAKADAANATTYMANAVAYNLTLDQLQADIAVELADVKNQPFVVFHDAFQYFDARFGLSSVGSISDISATSPSAARLQEVRTKIVATKAVCVFREPQFSDAAVATVIEGTSARSGVLDPIGAGLEPGASAYGQLLQAIATSLKACLTT